MIERETSAATHVDLPAALLSSPATRGSAAPTRGLAELAGAAAVRDHARQEDPRSAATFEEMRSAILDLAKEGIQVSRFKGLGEMNSEELWDTTMNPENRILVQVGVDDALLADRIFSMLMGDQVEPRREFIEQNAKYARLDV